VKVLHIGKYFPPFAGGMENYLRDLMVAQARAGIDSRALVHQSDFTLRSKQETWQARGQRLTVTRAALWGRVLYTPVSPTFGLLLRRLIKRERPDLLHLHLPNVSAFWALLVPSARKIPWILHWHADVLASRHSPGLRLFYKIYRPFERALLKRSSAIIATSPTYLESSAPLQAFHSKCHVIPLGLDPGELPGATAPDEPPGGHDHRQLRVLAVGRLTYYKGFEYLIRAMAQCEGVELNLVGSGEQQAKLRALTATLNLQQRVRFHDFLPDPQLDEQFRWCDCLCLPSIERTEAFGMVLLEAMLHAKATIISDVPGSGMGWVVDDGVTGLHVPPEDIAALAGAMRHLQQNRDNMRRLGKQGREKFDGQFHIDQSCALVSRLYHDISPEQESAEGIKKSARNR